MASPHHHAYIYEGSLAELPALAESAREQFGFPEAGDPDVQVIEFEKFGIEEARELVRTASLRSVSGRALYIVGVSSISTDAQQALLKLFEEPQEGTVFLLLAPYGSIIATLRSRLLPYSRLAEDRPVQHRGPSSVEVFLASPYAARSTDITKLLKDEDAVKERVRDFLNSLEIALYSKLSSRSDLDIRQGLEDVAKVRGYVGDRSPSMKMLLEHLAISLPTLK